MAFHEPISPARLMWWCQTSLIVTSYGQYTGQPVFTYWYWVFATDVFGNSRWDHDDISSDKWGMLHAFVF
jgi:hypothetical protein